LRFKEIKCKEEQFWDRVRYQSLSQDLRNGLMISCGCVIREY